MMTASTEKPTEEELAMGEVDVGQVLEAPEPWEAWETALCLWSVLIGIGALIVLGLLINIFLL